MDDSIITKILEESIKHSNTPEDWSSEALIKELCYASVVLDRKPLGIKNKKRLEIALREVEKRLGVKHPLSVHDLITTPSSGWVKTE